MEFGCYLRGAKLDCEGLIKEVHVRGGDGLLSFDWWIVTNLV